MVLDFDLHKKNILSKEDKSRKGSWDEKITELCNSINNNIDYCSTSSCSGRILIISNNSTKKHEVKYLFVSHDKISTNNIKDYFEHNHEAFFQIQSAIIHVICRNVDSARLLMQKARDSGFRRSGIINVFPYTVEIISDDSIQFPMIFNKEIINNDFLEKLCMISNNTLEKTWNKIKRLEKELS